MMEKQQNQQPMHHPASTPAAYTDCTEKAFHDAYDMEMITTDHGAAPKDNDHDNQQI